MIIYNNYVRGAHQRVLFLRGSSYKYYSFNSQYEVKIHNIVGANLVFALI